MPSLPDADSDPRHLHLEGAVNFRDIGGYETVTGQRVKWGSVYRADGLSELTASDIELIRSRNIKTVIDLRTTFEFENGAFPVNEVPVSFHHLPLLETVPDLESFKTIPGFLASSYVEMLEDAGPQIAEVLHLLADEASLPAVIHCTVGKDRTGVLIAVLLGVLQVSDEQIIEDYALSGPAMLEVRERLVARFPEAEEMIRDANEILSAEPENMEFLLTAVETQWGTLPDYALHLGVSPATCIGLKATLLEG